VPDGVPRRNVTAPATAAKSSPAVAVPPTASTRTVESAASGRPSAVRTVSPTDADDPSEMV
jgi:hypothetical protein